MIRFILLFMALISSAEASSQYFFAEGCRILDKSGKELLSMPGQMCLFFEDGSFASADHKGLRFFNHKKVLLWEIKGNFHHQLNLSFGKKSLLALSTEIITIDNVPTRADSFLEISFKGEILNKQNSNDVLGQANMKRRKDVIVAKMKAGVEASFEMSHFNSFYSIPVQKSTPTLSCLKEGNFIINSLHYGGFVLSDNLSRVLCKIPTPTSVNNFIHDMQVTDKGEILIFNNLESTKGSEATNSAIQILNPTTGIPIYSFTTEPKSSFFSTFRGGVQKLDEDHYLISNASSGVFLLSKPKANEIFPYQFHKIFSTSYVQQVYALELGAFLALWGIHSDQFLTLGP